MSNIKKKVTVEELERAMLTDHSNVIPICTTSHKFSDGVYIREITMPSDSMIVGAKHMTTHFNIISKGSCLLMDLETGKNVYIEAPYTFESNAGVRKVLYIIEECVWSTIHVTEEKNVEVLESTLIELSDCYKEVVGDKLIEGDKLDELLYGRNSSSNGNNITS